MRPRWFKQLRSLKLTGQHPSSPASLAPKVLVLLNPGAGMLHLEPLQPRISDYLDKKGVEFQIHQTFQGESIDKLVQEAIVNGYNRIVAAGGDGTVSQVANAVAGCSVPMGILPLGTANVVAKDLHIPLRLPDALELILSDPFRITRLDGMRIQDRYTILMVSAGFSANIFVQTRPLEKKWFGIFSYIWRGLLQLAGIQPLRFTLLVDGRKIRFSASDVLITNSALIGWQPLKLNPQVRMDDGRLSVCILRAWNLVDFVKIFWNMLLGRQRLARKLRWIDVQEWVEIQTSHPIPFQADGDVLGMTPFRVDFVPGIIQCIVPPDYPGAREQQPDEQT